MKFEVVIIGGGLAGLACGIHLLEQGESCTIISAGQNALHFSSGSLDLLSNLPDGTPVEQPLQALAELAQQAPQHPYSLLGAPRVTVLAQQAQSLLQRAGLTLAGQCEKNHWRMASLGLQRATWLSLPEIPLTPLGEHFAWRKPLVAGIAGFMDFQPQLVAASLQQQGIYAETTYLSLPLLDRLRSSSSEFRAVNIARLLDQEDNCSALASELNQRADPYDLLLLPACFGLQDGTLFTRLSAQLSKPLRLLPTLSPSVLGMRLHHQLSQHFQQIGGLLMAGDTVLRSEQSADGGVRLYTRNHTDIALRARQVVLASGSFFSKGLIAERNRIREPLFDLDVLETGDRAQWTRSNMLEPQPYLQFGVRTDSQLRAIRQGEVLDNIYVAGSVLGGFDPLAQGCGAGVSLMTALAVAQQIMAQ